MKAVDLISEGLLLAVGGHIVMCGGCRCRTEEAVVYKVLPECFYSFNS